MNTHQEGTRPLMLRRTLALTVLTGALLTGGSAAQAAPILCLPFPPPNGPMLCVGSWDSTAPDGGMVTVTDQPQGDEPSGDTQTGG